MAVRSSRQVTPVLPTGTQLQFTAPPVCGSYNLNEPAYSFDVEPRKWIHHEPARIQMPSVIAADAKGCRGETVRPEPIIWCQYA